MRNSWKGLAVGGLTGALVGIVIDAASKAVEQAVHGAEHARDRAPEAMDWLHAVTQRAGEWVSDADVPEHVRAVAQKIIDSDVAARAGHAATRVAGASMERAEHAASHVIETARERARSASNHHG